MKKNILLAGDDQPLWQAFRAECSREQSAWLPIFAPTELEALNALKARTFDAVVADVNLSDSRGIEVLDEFILRQPRALRIAISDIKDIRGTLKCIGKGHHHLLKPCGVKELLQALLEPGTTGTWRPSGDAGVLIAGLQRLPSPPTTYFQIVAEMRSPDAWIERIGDVIAHDPAVTAKVLQLANSAVFGLHLQVAHPRDAVMYIGLEATKALVLLAHTFSSFERRPVTGFSVEGLWRHSVICGRWARRIASLQTTERALAEEAFAAGLLHDLGKLLFAANLPLPYGRALARADELKRKPWDLERELLGASHAEIGACLLGIWGLPVNIVEAVALHHSPQEHKATVFNPLTAVHAANFFAHESSPAGNPGSRAELDHEYLKKLGLEQQVDAWRDHCRQKEQIPD